MLVHLHYASFDVLRLAFVWNELHESLRQLYVVFLLQTHLTSRMSDGLFPSTHHSHHPLLPHSFKLTCFTSHIPSADSFLYQDSLREQGL